MKTIERILLGFLLITFTFTSVAQEKEEYKPVYITITTGHWNSDPDTDYTDWLKTEQEYFNKVTKKNDLIIGSGYYTHYFTPDNSEILFVSVYQNWEDLENASGITDRLIEEGWPDKDKREAFFKKQSSYYSAMHSDEIYQTTKFRKPLKTESKKPLIYYVKRNKLGEGGKGFNEYFENITMKNSFLRGYYTHRHRWGANSRDMIEVFVFDKLSDIEGSFDETQKLVEAYWPDKDKRKAFFKSYSKIFSGHGDYIYQNVPELAK
ncbi:hypothetical protein [Lutibacter flavus]|uniref:NIPSNAP protein n=1 Tax=Lutibacter flavus TaxID=691689 RepID=A0A238XWD0_9FLAO|nr:hypothetical protein [Lutibacter flavus]SNR63022.1 hypothetical protein SAMN04488111_2163 [Lutibacter flavus]